MNGLPPPKAAGPSKKQKTKNQTPQNMTISCDAANGLAVSNHLQGVFVLNVENQVVHKMFQCPFFHGPSPCKVVIISIQVAWSSSHCWLVRSDWQGLMRTLEE